MANRSPDRFRKMTVIQPARDDVPVKVRNHVAQTGQIDLVRAKKGADDRFNSENYSHEKFAPVTGQIGHFLHMCRPYDTTKPRVMRIFNTNHPTIPRRPEKYPSRVAAQFARPTIFAHAPTLPFFGGLHQGIDNSSTSGKQSAYFTVNRKKSQKIRAKPVLCHLDSHARRSPPSSCRRADAWPVRPRCSRPGYRHRRRSGIAPADKPGRRSVS